MVASKEKRGNRSGFILQVVGQVVEQLWQPILWHIAKKPLKRAGDLEKGVSLLAFFSLVRKENEGFKGICNLGKAHVRSYKLLVYIIKGQIKVLSESFAKLNLEDVFSQKHGAELGN